MQDRPQQETDALLGTKKTNYSDTQKTDLVVNSTKDDTDQVKVLTDIVSTQSVQPSKKKTSSTTNQATGNSTSLTVKKALQKVGNEVNKFAYENTVAYSGPAAIAAWTGKYADEEELDDLISNAKHHSYLQTVLENKIGFFMSPTSDIAMNLMVMKTLGFLLSHELKEIPAYLRQVGHGHLGVGTAKVLVTNGLSYLIVCALNSFINHANNEILDGDWADENGLALAFMEYSIQNPFLAAFVQGTLGHIIFKVSKKMFELCMKNSDEERPFAPKTPIRWLLQKGMEGLGVVLAGEFLSAILDDYEQQNVVNNTWYALTYPAINLFFAVWYKSTQPKPIASPDDVKNVRIFAKKKDGDAQDKNQLTGIVISENPNDDVRLVKVDDAPEVSIKDKVKSGLLLTAFQLVGFGVGVGFVWVFDEARRRLDPEYGQEPSMLTKLGLGYLTWVATDAGTHVAKRSYNAVSSRFHKPKYEPLIEEVDVPRDDASPQFH